LLRELPERDNCAEKEKRIKNGFEHTATFLVGAHEKGVGRFVLAVHKVCQFDNLSCATFMSAAAPNTLFQYHRTSFLRLYHSQNPHRETALRLAVIGQKTLHSRLLRQHPARIPDALAITSIHYPGCLKARKQGSKTPGIGQRSRGDALDKWPRSGQMKI